MPLPFAPKPDESKVYQSLKSTLLQAVTPEQLDQLRSEVFAQGTDGSEDEYRRLILLGAASQAASISGPIPGTAKLIEVDVSTTGNNPFFIPEEGEAWQCIGAATGNVMTASAAILYLEDTGGTTLEIGQESSTNVTFTPNFGAPVVIDSEVFLSIHFSGNSAPGSKALAAFIRVR